MGICWFFPFWIVIFLCFGFFFSFIGNRFEFSLNEFWFGLCSLLKFYWIIDLILSGKGSWFNGFNFEFMSLGLIFWVCVLVFEFSRFVFLWVLVQDEPKLEFMCFWFLLLYFFFNFGKIDKLKFFFSNQALLWTLIWFFFFLLF